jgi:hypothetical protein
MVRFSGKVGYGLSVETVPGVWQDVIVEKHYYGDVLRNTRRLAGNENLNGDLTVSNSISVMADAYAYQQFINIKYVEWMGLLWVVDNVEVQRPRLLLSLGVIYNGNTAATSAPPGATPGE